MIRRTIGITFTSVAIFAVAIALTAFIRMSSASAAEIAEAPPIPSDQIPAQIKNVVASAGRPADDKKLDAGRQPEQMLAFFGIAPGMQVADIFAGGGYTTELLSRVVGPTGKVYSQNGPFPERFKKI
ncbi:MAG TPA: hypothetical protein VKV03_16660, partial [Candidatus Binataceae bacterium]|nr:hypothetical protein [Candidatus Binataceae bacterium]